MSTPLHVFVRTPTAVLFEGDATAVSSINEKGPFDILPYHEHFITLIHEKVEVRSSGEIKKWDVSRGILKASENSIQIFLDL